jgi:hypothetical protein
MMKRALAFVGALLLVAALVAAFVFRPRPDGVPEASATGAVWSCAAPCDRFTIAWGGDSFLGWAAVRQIEKRGMNGVLKHARKLIKADYSVINVESPWTTLKQGEAPDDPNSFYSYNADPATAHDLKRLGVDAVGLANNHTFDRGSQGVTDSIAAARAAGLVPFGTGSTEEEAGAPLMIDTPHGVLGVVAFNSTRPGSVGKGKAGFLPLSARHIEAGIERARAEGAKWVVGFVHWGTNYAAIDGGQKRKAAVMAAAGYDLVVGHGPHAAQPIGIVDGMPVLYSLGNFVFHTKGRYQKIGVPSESFTAVTYLGPDGFEAAELRCFDGDNRKTKFSTPPCKKARRADLFSRLGGLVQERGNVGVVRF